MSLERIRARTAARKAAGANQTYPHHAGKGAAKAVAPRTPKVTPLAVLRPCVHEGNVLETCHTCSRAKGEGRHVRECDTHGKCTREYVSGKVQACSRCPDYAPLA